MDGVSWVHSTESTQEEEEIKEDDFRLETNDSRMDVQWQTWDKISPEELID